MRVGRNDSEWLDLITVCRQSGLSDKAWCLENNISPSSFYNAVVRLRKKACEIPLRRESKTRMDLTAGNPDVVKISLVPDELPMPVSAIESPASMHLDNSHTIEMTMGGVCLKATNSIDPRLLQTVLSYLLGRQPC